MVCVILRYIVYVLEIYHFTLGTYEWIETTPLSEERLHAGSAQILEGGKIFQFYNIYEKMSSFFIKIFLRSSESVIFLYFIHEIPLDH